VAWVGRFDQDQKRIHDLPEILIELDKSGVRYQLSVAGDGPERKWVETHLKPWLVRGKVIILGRLSKLQLQRDVFASHHVLLITSSWETGPIVAWEAMAAGMAVVSSHYVGFRNGGCLGAWPNGPPLPCG
jgi:glycosyltransferase involved in cell wall biosynthesis